MWISLKIDVYLDLSQATLHASKASAVEHGVELAKDLWNGTPDPEWVAERRKNLYRRGHVYVNGANVYIADADRELT